MTSDRRVEPGGILRLIGPRLEHRTALAAGTRLGPYEVLELLGAGGMGPVYRARDPRLGREVAIKILPAELSSDSERRTRFERETRAVPRGRGVRPRS